MNGARIAGALALVLLMLLAGCASGPLKTEGVAQGLTPDHAVQQPEAAMGKTVLWGGVIVAAKNLEQRTRLEVVGYPLDRYSQRPQTDAQPVGRFLAYQDGYLETAEYGAGRRVTVRGTVTGTEQGVVGEAEYTYPEVSVESIELWPEQAPAEDRTRFHFGIGIILSN